MKKLIVLIGILGAFSASAENYQRMQVTALTPVENMYAAFEIKSSKYEKIVLDCQSFVHNMSFYVNKKVTREIRMVNYNDCESVYDFINQSLQDKKAVCMEIEKKSSTVNLSNDEAADCQ